MRRGATLCLLVLAACAPHESSLSSRRRFAIVNASAGVASIGIATWAGLDAAAKRDDARRLGCSDDLTRCSVAGLPVARDAYARASLSTDMFIGSAVLISAGALLWFTDPEPIARAPVRRWLVSPRVAADRAELVLLGKF